MMKYSALLLFFGMTTVLGQTIEKKPGVTCPEGGHTDNPKPSSCSISGGKCFPPICKLCKDGVETSDLCNSPTRHCCLPEVNECENNGGICLNHQTSSCNIPDITLDGCVEPFRCCIETRCITEQGGNCRNIYQHECAAGYLQDPGLCGGPRWIKCCPPSP